MTLMMTQALWIWHTFETDRKKRVIAPDAKIIIQFDELCTVNDQQLPRKPETYTYNLWVKSNKMLILEPFR